MVLKQSLGMSQYLLEKGPGNDGFLLFVEGLDEAFAGGGIESLAEEGYHFGFFGVAVDGGVLFEVGHESNRDVLRVNLSVWIEFYFGDFRLFVIFLFDNKTSKIL